ncbi:dihydrofolate reductase family protein [Nesterenkonia haasae]|uniref:dihydrofolate reductase family protein n=1 Tax=Nesterenkonia haasae TaxID=2587813 RepID=UPI001390CC7E|nr:dihydrofolate reductase family protein [Nesterenkonia haasae]NDK30539.1 dihydrofolate reductase [Nesterenkonia haasae]
MNTPARSHVRPEIRHGETTETPDKVSTGPSRGGTVFAFLFCSLDGYYEGPGGELDWGVNDEEFFTWNMRQCNEIGALLLGRRTYEHFQAFWTSRSAREHMPEVAQFMSSVPKLVVTGNSDLPPTWRGTTITDGKNLAADIARLGSEVAGDIAVFGSSELTTSLMQEGLIDELRILIHPVLLGSGRSLLNGLAHRVPLEAGPATVFRSGNVLLTYRPVHGERPL